MSCTISLRTDERKTLLDLYRHSPDPQVAHRAHILLLLADGHTWDGIATVLFTSASTIARWQHRFQQVGIEAVVGRPPGRRPLFAWHGASVAVRWVTGRSPRDFGFLRSRWTCAVVVALLLSYYQLAVSRELWRM
jgi:putative transposase